VDEDLPRRGCLAGGSVRLSLSGIAAAFLQAVEFGMDASSYKDLHFFTLHYPLLPFFGVAGFVQPVI